MDKIFTEQMIIVQMNLPKRIQTFVLNGSRKKIYNFTFLPLQTDVKNIYRINAHIGEECAQKKNQSSILIRGQEIALKRQTDMEKENENTQKEIVRKGSESSRETNKKQL